MPPAAAHPRQPLARPPEPAPRRQGRTLEHRPAEHTPGNQSLQRGQRGGVRMGSALGIGGSVVPPQNHPSARSELPGRGITGDTGRAAKPESLASSSD